MGHKGNRCQTKYGDATWRTTWHWRRSAVSDCVLVSSFMLDSAKMNNNNCSWKTMYDSLHTRNWSTSTIGTFIYTFESMFDIDKLLKMKKTLSCRFSGGTFTHSMPSLFASRVSILVAFATEGCKLTNFQLNSDFNTNCTLNLSRF